MKAPSFQFYAQDFLTGVMYLTNEEIGIYIKMLAKQWTDGKIPKKRLGFLVGLDWEKFSDELKEKFIDKGEYLINERLEEEREKKQNFLKKQSNNGSKGGRPSKKNKPKQNPNKSQKNPLEDENEIEDEKEYKNENESFEKSEKLLEISKLKTEIQNEFTWKETVCRNMKEVKSNFNPEEFDNYLEQFFKQIENDGEEVKTLQDTKKHFSRWLNIEITKHGKPNSITKQGPTDDFRRKTAKRLGIV